MGSKPLMLEGLARQTPEPDEGMLHKFRREKQQLEDDLRETRQELDDLRAEKERLERSVRNLRLTLSPLHRSLRALFGEIELAIGEETAAVGLSSASVAAQLQNTSDPRWESFKQTFPGTPARIIDALLAHQQMTYGQLKTLLRADYNTIKNAAAKLRLAGAVVKEGTMCRLNR